MIEAEVVNEVLRTVAGEVCKGMLILLTVFFGVIVFATFLSLLENKTLTPEELEGKRAGYMTYKKGPSKPS